jgi:hypothetical protein
MISLSEVFHHDVFLSGRILIPGKLIFIGEDDIWVTVPIHIGHSDTVTNLELTINFNRAEIWDTRIGGPDTQNGRQKDREEKFVHTYFLNEFLKLAIAFIS